MTPNQAAMDKAKALVAGILRDIRVAQRHGTHRDLQLDWEMSIAAALEEVAQERDAEVERLRAALALAQKEKGDAALFGLSERDNWEELARAHAKERDEWSRLALAAKLDADRYKAALENIAEGEHPDEAPDVARTALGGEGGGNG